MNVLIRPAIADDQEAILALTGGERVKPVGLRWPNFVVAEQDRRLIGAVQLRPHRDGSHELGTLVVERSSRNIGIASRLIDALLANRTGRIFMITGSQHADHYGRWGFASIEPRSAPACIAWNYRLGQYGGCLMAFFQRRAVKQLAILERRHVLNGTAINLMLSDGALDRKGRPLAE